MSNNDELYYILGLDENASDERIKNAYNIAKHAWTVNEFAPVTLKNRCKVQLEKIDKAYHDLLGSDNEKNIQKEELLFSNEEYEKFKVQTQEVEYIKAHIRYWWRLLYLSLILLILIILHVYYPIENFDVENQNIQQLNTQKTTAPQKIEKTGNKVEEQPKKSIPKEQINIQKSNDNVKKTNKNNEVKNSSSSQPEKETKTTQKSVPIKNSIQKENNPVQKTHEKTNSKTQNITSNLPQKLPQKVPQKTQSDFEVVSDYFE